MDRVDFGHLQVPPRARREAAFGDVDVQMETTVGSEALPYDKKKELVLKPFEKFWLTPTSEMETFVRKRCTD